MLHDTSRLLVEPHPATPRWWWARPRGRPSSRSVQLVRPSRRASALVVACSRTAPSRSTPSISTRPRPTPRSTGVGGAGRAFIGVPLDSPVATDGSLDESRGPTSSRRAASSCCSPVADEVDADQVFIGGTARMAAAFDAVGTVREVLRILEQQFVVVTLLRDVIDRGPDVAIGTETGMAAAAECSVVVAPLRGRRRDRPAPSACSGPPA